MDVKQFNEAEVATPADLTDIGLFARTGSDDIVGGAIAYPNHWAGFVVSQPNSLQIDVSAGALFDGAIIYRNPASTRISLQVWLPLISSDRKFVAILADGETETVDAQRLVETDAETEETVLQSVPKTLTRKINFTVMGGAPSPTPLRPAVPADRCCIAYVELSPLGVVAIEVNQPHRVKTLAEVDTRLTQAEGEIADVQGSVKTIKSDIAAIWGRLGDIPNPIIMRQLKADVAALRVKAKLPAEARAYWYDPGLVGDQWDGQHSSWLARIREGVRFAFAAERDAQLALLNVDDPGVRLTGNLMLPAWTEERRLEVKGDGGSFNISSLQHTIVTAVQKTLSRVVTEYGPTISVCENAAEWAVLQGRSVGELFNRPGETFQIVSVDRNHTWAGHRWLGVRRVIQRTVVETYWDYVRSTVGLNGSVCGQTFLNAQAAIVTSVELSFTSVGVNGDVHLMLCECWEDGEPNFDAVVARVTKPANQLAKGWVTFSLTPTLLDPGKRFA